MTTRTHIRAHRGWWQFDLREIWDYRDLLHMLIRRDLTAVYKQTVLGPVWFVIQPLAMTMVFTVIFGRIAAIPTDGLPQILFYMSGTVLWNYFQGCMSHGAGALIANAHVLSKVYFPRLLIPLQGVCVQLAHFGLNLLMFLGFYFYFLLFTDARIQPGSGIVFLPLAVAHCAMVGLGAGLWVAALTTRFRDLTFAVPFLTQLWLYATPIVWPSSLVVSPWSRAIVYLNPMTAPVEFTRRAFTGAGAFHPEMLLVSLGVTALLLLTGLLAFNRAQRTFVDTI
jgi:lipopolysaccharide transport system permease protein